MALPVHYSKLEEIPLDDRKFQDLVDEARKRVRQYCPEWTEFNLSDPGVTLIELFAWMTELILYRLNQVPQKNYIKFLEMLGYGLLPARAATTELTFRLAAPFPVNPADSQADLCTTVKQGLEVSTGATGGEPIVFTTERHLAIRAPKIQELRHPSTFGRNFWKLTSTGELSEEFVVFAGDKPQNNDFFYIGFKEPDPLPSDAQNGSEPAPGASRLAGHIIRLTVFCKQEPSATVTGADGLEKPTAGHRRNQPPLVWEYCDLDSSTSDAFIDSDQADANRRALDEENKPWKPLRIGREGDDKDTTGGLYNEEGTLTLFLPLTIQPHKLSTISAVWVRCRYKEESDNKYSVSPIIKHIQVQTIGASTLATNSRRIGKEELGISNGEPGQSFRLRHSPLLLPGALANYNGKEGADLLDEYVYVELNEQSAVPKQRVYHFVDTFAFSDQHSDHILVNPHTGEVHFGPTIRQQDGSLRQYGRVPPVGSRIFITGYHYHAGANGNVPAGFLRVMHQSVPYVDSVNNAKAVGDGRDQETVAEAIMRAQRALRAQERAVSAQDFETLTLAKFKQASIARVKCLTPDDFIAPVANEQKPLVAAGTVDLLLVLAIKRPDLADNWRDLAPSRQLCEQIKRDLQPYCLLARSVQVRKPTYRGIKVTISVVPYWAQDWRKDEQLANSIRRFLYRYFSPLPYGVDENEPTDDLPAPVRSARWQGWNFGEPLVELRLRGLLQEVDGVKYIDKLTIYYADLPTFVGLDQIKLQEFDAKNLPNVPPDLLYCSFTHEVKIVRVGTNEQ